MNDPLTHASAEELEAALRQEADVELQVRAACAVGDQLRFGQLEHLPETLRAVLLARAEGDTLDDLAFEAAIALCEAGDSRGAVLLRALDDKNRRFDAIKALSRLRSSDVTAALRRHAQRFFLPWPDRLVASAACAVLGDKVGAAYFESALTSRFFTQRRAMALHLFGDLRHPEAFTVLMSLAEKVGDPWRPVAIRALGHLGDKRAIAALRTYTGDVDEDVRYALELLT